MLSKLLPKPASGRRIYLVFSMLIITAWGALIAWQHSPHAELLGHESLVDHHITFTSHLSAFLLGWLFMTVAMMLPANLPLLIHEQRNRMGDGWYVLMMIAGYLSAWMLFGLIPFVGDSILHEMTEPGAPLAAASNFIAPAILLTAGVYQLTPLKRRFTERCKPSLNSRPSEHDMHKGGAFPQGLRLGLNCIGSCWSLMLLMFALGHHRLDWMLIIGGIAAMERLTPWGLRVERMVGAGLIGWGIFTVITTL